MNKQEAIRTIEQDKIVLGNVVETSSGVNTFQRKIESTYYVPLGTVVSAITKINEQQKPVVPKFVAEWITYCKQCTLDLQDLLSRLEDRGELYDWAHDENDGLISERLDMIARAWLDDYTVEKEKLYTVEIPNPNLNAHVVLQKTEKGVVLVTVGNARWKGWESSKVTEAEIKKDFERLWWYAKEVK